MNGYDASVAAFNNGMEYMKEKILQKLTDSKGKALGVERATLSDIIEMIKRMEAKV